LRLVTFEYLTSQKDGTQNILVGELDPSGQFVSELEGAADMLEVIPRGPNAFRRRTAVELDNLRLLAPILKTPKNIICAGLNYHDHVQEGTQTTGHKADEQLVPVLFSKPYTSIIGPEQPIRFNPSKVKGVDWEGELAVVIGKRGSDISEDEAFDYIFGYSCLNDISARLMQMEYKQWYKGKGLDTFCPLGPWLVTADEIDDPQNLELRLRVNGVTKQAANTRDMIFNIRQLISAISLGMTLEPGDIIATGTPSGVGAFRNPPEFLKDGDRVEVEIEKIGVLSNPVKTY
jgi:2-keto-4-pentenoate hydratase/2-oxohepta-3-ene-1,7-dioic acid hydratase in catechol pathway